MPPTGRKGSKATQQHQPTPTDNKEPTQTKHNRHKHTHTHVRVCVSLGGYVRACLSVRACRCVHTARSCVCVLSGVRATGRSCCLKRDGPEPDLPTQRDHKLPRAGGRTDTQHRTVDRSHRPGRIGLPADPSAPPLDAVCVCPSPQTALRSGPRIWTSSWNSQENSSGANQVVKNPRHQRGGPRNPREVLNIHHLEP